MKIIPSIACGGLLILGGCQKAEPTPSGNHTPVNAAVMPTPEVSATDAETTGTDVPTPAPTPDTSSSPAAPAASPSPGT